MKRLLLLVLLSSIVLSACSKGGEVDVSSRYGNTMDDFEVVDQNDETFKKADMDGKVYLVDFIFTNCTTVCPPMTHNMTSVVEDLEKDGVENYAILSFSVDPKRDTPEVLREYIDMYHINDLNADWTFVTGYDYEFIRKFSEKNFKTIVAPPPEGSDQITHGTSFYLVDENGKIIKDYSGVDSGDKRFPKEEIVSDIKKLTKNL